MINQKISFHTVHARSTAKCPSSRNTYWAITQRMTRVCHMKCKRFCGTTEATKIAPWLYMIWFITGMWTSFYNLSDLGSEKHWWTKHEICTKPHQNFQGRICLGKTTCSNTGSSPSWSNSSGQHNCNCLSYSVEFESTIPPTKMIS